MAIESDLYHERPGPPSQAEIEWARRVLAAFAQSPEAGVVNLDGRMVDKPHLLQARRILDRPI